VLKKPVKLFKYVSAKKIMQTHNQNFANRVNKINGIGIGNKPIEWGDEELSLNDEQIIEHLNINKGYLAFSDTLTRTIHVWFDNRVSEEKRFRVLAHELAHITGNPCRDPLNEEERCDGFARLAVEVYRLWTNV